MVLMGMLMVMTVRRRTFSGDYGEIVRRRRIMVLMVRRRTFSGDYGEIVRRRTNYGDDGEEEDFWRYAGDYGDDTYN